MNVQIEKTARGLSVRIDGLAGRERLVLEKIRDCRASAWACPSGECTKIGTMEERRAEGTLALALTARDGQELSAAGIDECLRYVLQSFR